MLTTERTLRRLTVVGLLSVLVAVPTGAQEGEDRSERFVRDRGQATYRSFCASCHGVDGTGDGPVAKDLRIPPPDLTRIAARRGGEFPTAWVYEVIEGRARVRGHGSEDMPIWGDVFQSPVVDEGGRPIELGPNLATRRIHQLVEFLASAQVKEEASE